LLMKMKISESMIKKVRFMLKNYEQARESDMYLVAMIWRYERGETFGKKSEFAFLGDLANMKGLSHFGEIALAAKKVKEDNPELKHKDRLQKWKKV